MNLLLRILFTGAFIWLMRSAATESSANLDADVVNAGRFALAVLVGFIASATWAPVLGDWVAGPVTGLMTDGTVSSDNPTLVRWGRSCAMSGHRRLAVMLAFLEGVRRPLLPAAFVVGMDNSQPGSWLQYVFAREVWRFNSVANCLRAYFILLAYREKPPRRHPVAEINLALIANLRPPAEPAEILAVPPAPPPPPLKRNDRIKLFKGADSISMTSNSEAGSEAGSEAESTEANTTTDTAV